MWLIITKSRDGRYMSGGEIYKQPGKNIYSVYDWVIHLKPPIKRKRIPNKVFYNWAIKTVGPKKIYKEFDDYDEARRFLIEGRINYSVIEL